MSTLTMSQAQERLQECVRASMAETLHVLGSRENALRLLEAMKEMDEGRNCVTVDPREFFAK